MKRPVKHSSSRGFLLVEAVLSAVVIAVGLVFISRGLSSPLRAIRTVEEYDVLLALARGKLLELEGEQIFGFPAPADLTGAFEEPSRDYRWIITAQPRGDMSDPAGKPLTSDVSLTVARERAPTSVVRLGAIWHSEWISR